MHVFSGRIICNCANEDLSFVSACTILKDQQVSDPVLSDVRLGSKHESEV